MARKRCANILVENEVAQLMGDSKPIAPLCGWRTHWRSPREDNRVAVARTVPKTAVGLEVLANNLQSQTRGDLKWIDRKVSNVERCEQLVCPEAHGRPRAGAPPENPSKEFVGTDRNAVDLATMRRRRHEG